jgi:hypothetical protein
MSRRGLKIIIFSFDKVYLCTSGLPDGFFSNQKSQFGEILEGPRLENVAIFYGHLEYFKDIEDILGPFGTFCVHLVHFSGFGILFQEKSGNPDVHALRRNAEWLQETQIAFQQRFIQIFVCFNAPFAIYVAMP